MKGGDRRSKPAALRALHGSRRRPRHKRAVPLDPVTGLRPPPGLTAPERRCWRYYAPLLEAAKVLTGADRAALANFCIAQVQIADIRTQQRAPDYRRLIGTEKVKTHPLDAQLRAWLLTARLAGAELGLSPGSRARVAPTAAGQEIDELERFLAQPLRRVK